MLQVPQFPVLKLTIINKSTKPCKNYTKVCKCSAPNMYMQFIQLKRYEHFLRVENTVSLWLQITDLLSLQQLAIRGYHVYQKIWQPELNETLHVFTRNNEFDAFSVKTVRAIDNATVAHLPREISRPTKYLLDRGATVKVLITCSYYRRSPLFQGGLEIPCSVTVNMPGTIRNHLQIRPIRRTCHSAIL